ncbi:Phage Terminase [Stratiformator vulcanicus]|uniref:Phage Terminase n=1 Tax=Stratiformator vulcanicus TaxID=2527980 RepID=A0A517QWR8_9PLAN|nr:Phage Terminase [Stratiformator vulcanicus]
MFRHWIRLSPHDRNPFGRLIEPWQEQDFAALDAAWVNLCLGDSSGGPVPTEPGGAAARGLGKCSRESERCRTSHDPTETSCRSATRTYSVRATPNPLVRRAYLERPRGHAKTSDTALSITWALLFAERPLNGYVVAADVEQSSLVVEAIARLKSANPTLLTPLKTFKHAAVNKETESVVRVVSSHVASSWGLLPDFVICDELCHWKGPDIWESVFSSAAKQPDGVLIVLSNAGVGRGWDWQLRESARNDPGWYFSTFEGPRAGWLRVNDLEEQRSLLPPPVYARLWENRWQHGDGEFVTIAEAEACRDEGLIARDSAAGSHVYFAAVDYGEKHDFTVGVVLHAEGETLIVDRMDVVVPTPNNPVPVQWVEDWIERTAERFGRVKFVVDEYQLAGVVQRLSQRHDIERFEFAAGRGNHELAMTLRHMIAARRIRWYPGCGQREDTSECDDIETELASLLLKQASTGRVRIDHRHGFHDDRAFALGAAVLAATKANSEDKSSVYEITPPTFDGGFAL